MRSDTDVKLVIVTGAGASTALGHQPLPLMQEWSERLRRDLDEFKPGLPAALGLTGGSTGAEFEEVVGSLLRWRSTLQLNRRFHRLGQDNLGGVVGQVKQWFEVTETHGEAFERVLWESLWREFGLDAISPEKARIAWASLVNGLHLGSRPFVIATTNYDLSIELALTEIGIPYADGFEQTALATPFLQPRNIVNWNVREGPDVGVLHLHGAVGWYRSQDDDRVYKQHADQAFNSTLGSPAVIAPDPSKNPETDTNVGPIWREFRTALDGATHVLVIGHSLSDEPLVQALAASRTEISVVGPDVGNVGDRLPSASGLVGTFGPSKDSLEDITEELRFRMYDETTPPGL